MGQDLPQPADQLLLRCAAKLTEVSVGLQERILNEVGGIDFPLESPADL
jgi:hypothetical protein